MLFFALKSISIGLLVISVPVFAAPYRPCVEDSTRKASRSAELKKIFDDDQAERSETKIKPGAQFRDRKRRERVGAIFGEGCFTSSEDFYHAAYVFQHGGDLTIDMSSHTVKSSVPDQLFIAFVWAKRAYELGYEPAKRLTAEAVDRYLNESGRKQLFGTQFNKGEKETCWCQMPVESSFPDSERIIYTGKTLAQIAEKMRTLPGWVATCGTRTCDLKFSDSPKGTVLGFW
jgi:hypothetical protein